MTDQTAAESVAPEPAPEPPGPPPPTYGPPPPGWRPPRQRLRDRAFRFRSVLAVGLAGLVIGGGAGAGGMAIAKSGSEGGHPPGRGQFPGPREFPGHRPSSQLPCPGAGPGYGDSREGASSS